MRFFLLIFTVNINSALLHSKLLILAFFLENLEIFPFTVGASRKNCPSARCASASNTVCKDVDILANI
jgi:hypothetical protein